MKTIKNIDLFNDLINAEKNNNDLWDALFLENDQLKDYRIPILAGGLDRIEKNSESFIFFDIGMHASGHNRNNTFKITK